MNPCCMQSGPLVADMINHSSEHPASFAGLIAPVFNGALAKSHFCCDYRLYCTSLQPDLRKSQSGSYPALPMAIQPDLYRLPRYYMRIPEFQFWNET